MKKPTLRFRQVFEHPTHFKVTKPLGNPLIIAKKALSPSMQVRLRKFANGGDVTDPVESADDAPEDPRSRVGAPEEMAKIELDRELSKPSDEQDQDYIAQLQNTISPPPPPAPEPHTNRAIPSTREPVAMEPAQATPVATAETPAAQPPVAVNVVVPQQPSAPVAPAASAVMPPAPAPVLAPAPAVVSEQAPAMAAPAAPVPTPAPVVAPVVSAPAVKPPAPAPVVSVPDVGASQMAASPESITVDGLQKLMKANPGKTPQQLAVDLVRSALPPVGASPELIAKTADVLTNMESDQVFNEGMATQLRGIVNEAKSETQFAKETADISERALADRLVIAEKNKSTLEALGERKKLLENAVAEGFKPESFYGRMDTVSKIGTAFALFLGGFASGLSKTPNYVLKSLEDAMDRDLDAQKKKYDSVYNQYVRALGDYDAADKLTRADLADIAALQVKAISARQDQAKIGPAADILVGKLQMEAAQKRAQVAEAQYKADVAASEAKYADEKNQSLIDHRRRMGTGVGTASGARAVIAERNYELRLRRFEDDLKRRENSSEFTVPNPSSPEELIVIKTRDVPDGRAARKETLQRVTALSRVEELDNILNSKRTTQQALSPQEVARVRILVNEITENYPSLAKGTTQLVTQAQAKLLKDSVEDLVPLPYAKWGNFSGMTGTAIQKLREEGSRMLKVSVNNYARPEDPGAAQFNTLFTKKGFAGRVGELPEKPKAAAGTVRVKDASENIFTVPAANLSKALKRGYVEVK